MSSLRTFPLGFPPGNVPASWVPQGVEKPRCCGSSWGWNSLTTAPSRDRSALCPQFFRRTASSRTFPLSPTPLWSAPKGTGRRPPATSPHWGWRTAYPLPVRALSGGMKRRVSIARAVLAPGPLLVLDEPFTGLDRTTKAVVLDYLKRYTQGRTLLLVTHDPAERDALAHSTLQMPSQIT